MSEVIVDVEWALREWLRALNPTIGIWFDVPKGTPSFPFIVVGGRIGGTIDDYADIETPRITFQVWGGKGGAGRDNAFQTAAKLVADLKELGNADLDEDTHGYGASDITVLWLPDRTDPSNILARYVVDANVTVRSV